jgi:hypothetical protein
VQDVRIFPGGGSALVAIGDGTPRYVILHFGQNFAPDSVISVNE